MRPDILNSFIFHRQTQHAPLFPIELVYYGALRSIRGKGVGIRVPKRKYNVENIFIWSRSPRVHKREGLSLAIHDTKPILGTYHTGSKLYATTDQISISDLWINYWPLGKKIA